MTNRKTMCYCDQCKTSLTADNILDQQHVWCPDCKELVLPSAIRMRSWALGIVVILLGDSMFHVLC